MEHLFERSDSAAQHSPYVGELFDLNVVHLFINEFKLYVIKFISQKFATSSMTKSWSLKNFVTQWD